MPGWLIVATILASLFVAAWLIEQVRDARRYRALKPRLDFVDAAENALKRRQEDWSVKVQSDNTAITQLAREKAVGFPWLAEAYAEYFHLKDLKEARGLETKKRPAHKAADSVRDIAAKRRQAEKLQRILSYQLKYYEKLFPWLEEFRQHDVDEVIIQVTTAEDDTKNESDDPVARWLAPAEYRTLSASKRNQLALDRYRCRPKSHWEIGRDYERYIGYRYELAGAKVTYHGIIEGMDDLGRDLIAEFADGRIEIVQCKCWSLHKQIHEKHIFQLHGTVVAHRIDRGSDEVRGVFYTSTALSERAKQFAAVLGISYFELQPLEAYPAIKCNVSDRGKIYHLPFDQQYDRTIIRSTGERYVETVAQAERLGFRRAHRWHGANQHGAGA